MPFGGAMECKHSGNTVITDTLWMGEIMIKFIMILVGVFSLLINCEVAQACDEASARLVAKSYVLTMPLLGRDNEMIPLMQSNHSYFTPEGDAVRCMQELGTALINEAIKQAETNNGPSAQELFGGMMPEGLGHLPGEVDDSMHSYANDLYAMGQELIWLSRVLPAAAQGNYTPYNTTGTQTRMIFKQVLPRYQMLCQINPFVCQNMLDTLYQMTPQLEQVIYTFARQLDN